jgi:hypothetical protein
MSKDEITPVGVEVTVRSKPGATGLVVGFISNPVPTLLILDDHVC